MHYVQLRNSRYTRQEMCHAKVMSIKSERRKDREINMSDRNILNDRANPITASAPELVTVPATVSINELNPDVQALYLRLYQAMEAHITEGLAIAFSGGVDSSLLLRIACEVGAKHHKPVLAVTFETKLHPHGDLSEAKQLAECFGALHKTIEVDEFADPEIMNNPIDRCYRCKTLLFNTFLSYAHQEGYHYLMDGTNYDDLKVYRPGRKALSELGIHSPLMENQVTKAMIRALSADLGIPTSDKPSAPCLATRLPYGARLDFELLSRLDQGEQYLKGFGFYNVRLRLHGDILRIELDKKDFEKLLRHQEELLIKLKELGFLYITLDLEGFRSGSMDIHIQQ